MGEVNSKFQQAEEKKITEVESRKKRFSNLKNRDENEEPVRNVECH